MLHYVIQQWKYLQTGRFIDLNFTLSSLKSLFAKARSRYLTFQWDCFSTCYNNAAFLFNVFFKLSTELVALSLSKRYQIIGSACEGRHTEGLIAFIMQWAVCCHPAAAAFAPTGPVPLSFAKQELPPGFHCLNIHSFFFLFIFQLLLRFIHTVSWKAFDHLGSCCSLKSPSLAMPVANQRATCPCAAFEPHQEVPEQHLALCRFSG